MDTNNGNRMTKHCSETSLLEVSPQPPLKGSSRVRKESTYYFDNYEATVTVHKSPPQQRKQYFDYIEIDDETRDEPENVYPYLRQSKRKNLRVTFSDHIDVDIIEDYDSFDDEKDKNSVVEETVYEIPTDRTKSLKQITCSGEFRTVTENMSPRHARAQTVWNTKIAKKTVITKKTSLSQPSQDAYISQPLLQKRRNTDQERKTKEYIYQLQEKTKGTETHARLAQTAFPDISAKIKSQPNYKQFIANARRAVEVTRRYERPWINGRSQQQCFNMWKQRSETVRRTASLPKNFKLPEKLTTER